jgi:hypothetical protein
VTIVGGNTVGATLTITTTAPQQSTCSAANQRPRPIPWYATGGAVLACLLMFGVPARRRSWRSMLGLLALLVALTSGVLACGGGGGGGSTCTPGPVTPGTTTGAYTFTVTGTSGSTVVSSNPITLEVQ